MSISRGWTAALVASAIAFAGSAQAAPIYYQFASGQAAITVTKGATSLTPVAALLSLNGIFADFDQVAPALTNFQFTTTPNQAILLSSPYAGYDQIVVNSASMIPGVGYAHYAASILGGGNFSVAVYPVHVDGIYSASFSGGPPPPAVSSLPIMFDNTTPLTATVNVNAGTFTLLGITLAVIAVPYNPLSPYNETIPLVVKADLTFQGMVPVPVPEPGVLSLVGVGLVGLAALRSRWI